MYAYAARLCIVMTDVGERVLTIEVNCIVSIDGTAEVARGLKNMPPFRVLYCFFRLRRSVESKSLSVG